MQRNISMNLAKPENQDFV